MPIVADSSKRFALHSRASLPSRLSHLPKHLGPLRCRQVLPSLGSEADRGLCPLREMTIYDFQEIQRQIQKGFWWQLRLTHQSGQANRPPYAEPSAQVD